MTNGKKSSPLSPFKDSFEKALQEDIAAMGGQKNLRAACAYALANGGRIRPLVVLLMAQALGHNLQVFDGALSVEYFHTASLIADDLPALDNDSYRRNRPALHREFGEATALLASYALISAGYEKIFKGSQAFAAQQTQAAEKGDKVCSTALNAATQCAGIAGAVGGQFQDIYGPKSTFVDVCDIIYKKTVTLFEISFSFGWIFGGGKLEEMQKIKEVAFHFGMAFQVADDISDFEQDGKDSPNLAQLVGKERAFEIFQEEVKAFTKKMEKLNLFTPEFLELTMRVKSYISAGSSAVTP